MTTVQNIPDQSEVACICTLSAFYNMAKQHCREVSPHATDEGKASIKKKYDKLGILAEVRGEGSEWVLKAKPWAHAVRNRKRNIGMSANISVELKKISIKKPACLWSVCVWTLFD